MSDDTLLAYYSRRAEEYERIYQKPERQEDLGRLREWLLDQLRFRHVLEIACGTGYWTRSIAPAAASVTATDASREVLEIARAKVYPPGRVQFQEADAFTLEEVSGKFDAALAAFWFSHVARGDRPRFLAGLHRKLEPGAAVVMIDNRYVPGSSTPIARSDGDGNTYQLRTLDDGSAHEILKNFPSFSELSELLEPYADGLIVREFEYFWAVRYNVRAASLHPRGG